jgi:hypothetical protein
VAPQAQSLNQQGSRSFLLRFSFVNPRVLRGSWFFGLTYLRLTQVGSFETVGLSKHP